MTVVVIVCGVLIAAGAALAIVRMARGPSILDRTVALDVVVTCIVAAFALYAALARRTDVVPILVALSLVGFIGSFAVARFAAAEPEDARRVRSREEVAAREAQQWADELADDRGDESDDEPSGPPDDAPDVHSPDDDPDTRSPGGSSADEQPTDPADNRPADNRPAGRSDEKEVR
ncbi:MAG: monovalent cation/H+ antiporter complex subunit F [Micrococcales bacterium]|nr:monovalent cation/H+ antiporter complex subunit F [Micrococcales bacterium]